MNRITLINVISEWVLLAQSCPTLCDPTDSSPPGSSVHGILQVRILQWVAIFSSRGSSQPRDWTHVSYVSCTGREKVTGNARTKLKQYLRSNAECNSCNSSYFCVLVAEEHMAIIYDHSLSPSWSVFETERKQNWSVFGSCQWEVWGLWVSRQW